MILLFLPSLGGRGSFYMIPSDLHLGTESSAEHREGGSSVCAAPSRLLFLLFFEFIYSLYQSLRAGVSVGF